MFTGLWDLNDVIDDDDDDDRDNWDDGGGNSDYWDLLMKVREV